MRQVAMRYGLMLGLISIAISLVSNLMGLSDPRNASPGIGIIISIVSLAITAVLISFALKQYRDEVNDGLMSLGQALSVGILVALIAGLIASLFSVLYATVIEPGYYETIIAATEETLEDRGMSEDEIDAALRITRMFTNPLVGFLASLIGSLFFGFIISLIAGLIMKREPQTGV